jgi:UDP-2,3-diacylglucosamine hydrolase
MAQSRTTKKRTGYRSAGRKKAYFFSDVHLGLGPDKKEREKESRLVGFLEGISQDAGEIYIVGDLFDYWFEYKTVVPKGYFRLLAKLAELRERSIRIFFIAGNHDYWMKDYFRDEIGIEMHHEPLQTEILGKRFYIHHGDGLLKKDIGYKILKKILRNRFNIALFSLIHPDLAGLIARWSSRTSRRYTSSKKYEDADMTLFAGEKISEGFDFVIMGHNHIPSCSPCGGGYYVNLGDWITENTYAVFDGNKIELKKFGKREIKHGRQ